MQTQSRRSLEIDCRPKPAYGGNNPLVEDRCPLGIGASLLVGVGILENGIEATMSLRVLRPQTLPE
jgi:hypothetical protein